MYCVISDYSHCVVCVGVLCGWWRIHDPDELKQVAECLHERGIREHAMARNLVKYTDYAAQTCKRVVKDST